MTISITASPSQITTDATEAYAIAKEAYFYFYPLLLMEATRKQCINSEAGKIPGFAPPNTFSHIRAYPDADFRTVVRPNFDTLYSIAWLDLSQEPQVISIPDSENRYYLLPFLDMWTDVFAVPGWRTSGTTAQHYALIAPGWTGTISGGIEKIDAPTSWVWIIGRTKTDGPDDYASVHKFQDGLSVTPLSSFGKNRSPAAFKADPTVDMKTPPMAQVDSLTAENFFALASKLLKLHKPHITDWSIIQRIEKLGLSSDRDFDFSAFTPEVQKKLDRATVDALQTMKEKIKLLGRQVNGWTVNTDTIGVYGNSYLNRAMIALIGLGANQPNDAIYPLNNTDADGNPLDGKNNYVLHFDKTELPPVDAFWSVTMYDKEGFQSANSINRFAISSWMPLKTNADGSLDIYIQNDNPGADKEVNWLPAPKGELGVTLRLYAPKLQVLDGSWNPPAIRKV
jgi:Uncharacterized conserved protein